MSLSVEALIQISGKDKWALIYLVCKYLVLELGFYKARNTFLRLTPFILY